MTLRKKIFGSLFVLVCLGIVGGGIYWWLEGSQLDAEKVLDELATDWPEVDLSFSPLGELEMPEMDLGISFNLSGIDTEMKIPPVYTSEDLGVQIGTPSIPDITFGPADIQNIIPQLPQPTDD
jgi:hypothetical protein